MADYKPSFTSSFIMDSLVAYLSPYMTPIRLVETKQNTGEHHMAQDLGTISKSVIPIHPIVPNPYTLFLQVPHEAK